MEAKNISKLVEAAQKGDNDAFEKLYYATNKSGYFLAYNITHDEEAAKDILQDSYINAFINIKSLKKKEKFQKWFNVIVVNGSKNYIIKNKPNIFSEYDGEKDFTFDDEMMNDDFIPEKSLDNKEIRKMLKEIIDSLPDDQRLCVLMYYYQQMDTKSIAKQLCIAEGTVRSRLYYGRLYIKKKVEALEKNGIKLYGAMPVPLAIWALKSAGSSTLTSGTYAAIYKSITLSAGKAAAGTVTTAIGTKLFIGGISAAVIIVAGVLGINYIQNKQPKEVQNQTVQATVEETEPASMQNGLPTIATESTEHITQMPTHPTEQTEAHTNQSFPGQQTQQEIITTYHYQTQATEAFTEPVNEVKEKIVTFDYKVYENKVTIVKYTGNETNVVVPSTIEGMAVNAVGEKAFADNKFITSIYIPDSINEVSDGMFSGCSSLEKVFLSNSIQRIGIYAFAYCNSLKEVNIPNTVTDIGYCAFMNCSSLESLYIPKATISIGVDAFKGDEKLIIKCDKYSYAWQYAEKYKINYIN